MYPHRQIRSLDHLAALLAMAQRMRIRGKSKPVRNPKSKSKPVSNPKSKKQPVAVNNSEATKAMKAVSRLELDARNRARKGTRGTEYANRNAKRKGKRGVETQKRASRFSDKIKALMQQLTESNAHVEQLRAQLEQRCADAQNTCDIARLGMNNANEYAELVKHVEILLNENVQLKTKLKDAEHSEVAIPEDMLRKHRGQMVAFCDLRNGMVISPLFVCVHVHLCVGHPQCSGQA